MLFSCDPFRVMDLGEEMVETEEHLMGGGGGAGIRVTCLGRP